MSGFEHWLSGHDSMSGPFMLLLWAAGVLTAVVIVVAVLAFRDFAARETIDILLRSAVVVIVAVLGWALLDYSILRERLAERRALDARASELAGRAMAPGSALGCLNALENEVLQTACDQAVFASPQAVAAAVAYVDARITLLADGLEYASRDRSYAGALERPRRALEADRFGIVAHVLASRGCSADDCAAFKLLKDASRVQANLKDRTFEARLATYATAWSSANTSKTVADTPPTAATPPQSASTAATAPGASPVSKFNFPSANSIPPVSIMSAEPTGTVAPNASDAAAPAPERRAPPAHRQSANKPPPAPAKPLPPPPQVPPATAPAQGPSLNPQ